MAEAHWGPVEKDPRGSRAPKKPVSRRRRWTVRILKIVAVTAAFLLVAGVGVVFFGYTTTKLPNPNSDFTTSTTMVYYNDGKTELGSFAVQNRQPLAYKDMPKNMTNAIVAAENRTFWTDKGISFRGMARAAYAIARGGSVQGGSTITQQYIKIFYLTSDQTATRKFKELFLAYKISKERSKEKILEDYLNTIYFGHGAYGIQAASQAFFNIDAKDLTVRQSAVLSSVVNNPTYFDPSDKDHRPELLDRYRYVLNSMAEMGYITPDQLSKWSPKLPKFPKVPINERYGGPKGFLLKMVQNELSSVAGLDSSRINGGGLQVTTTFDKDAQAAAVESAQRVTKQAADASGQKASKLHAAVASVDVNSGAVLALYGGPDYVKNSRNWATTARPTASTFKAYALAAGLKDGKSLYSTYNGNSFYLPDDPQHKKIVRNENSYQYGPQVTLLLATTESINTAFVDLVTQMDDGKKKVLKVAKAAGDPKTTGWNAAPRNIPIGTPEVSPLNQASAYASFANDGTHVADHVVKEVRDAKGTVLYRAQPEETRVVSADIADDVTFALSSVVKEGTGTSVQSLNRPVAGKTGTNGVEVEDKNGNVGNVVNSSWFVGYTKQISTAVMFVAGKAGNSSLDVYRRPGDSTFFGGTYPAQTWASYMQTATKGQAVKEFDPPAYVNRDSAPRQSSAPARDPSTFGPTERPTSSASSEPSPSGPGDPSGDPSGSGGPSSTPRPSTSATRRGLGPGGSTTPRAGG